MTDTEVALLRAVREAPDDDLPRLVIADYYDGVGEYERAEFIRFQLAHPTSTTSDESSGLPIQDVILRRGFVGAVTLTMSRFMGGGECGTCHGTGRQNWEASFIRTSGQPTEIHPTILNRVSDLVLREANCPACRGTGQTPGLARDLFERWPITAVRLSDREPQQYATYYHWNSSDCHYAEEDATELSMIPVELFKRVQNSGNWITFRTFPTPEDARAALSDACCAYGRGLVGLQPIPHTTPGNPAASDARFASSVPRA